MHLLLLAMHLLLLAMHLLFCERKKLLRNITTLSEELLGGPQPIEKGLEGRNGRAKLRHK